MNWLEAKARMIRISLKKVVRGSRLLSNGFWQGRKTLAKAAGYV